MLRRGAGNVPIAAVAQVVGISPRVLRRGFAVGFGVTPKQAARIIRFDRARRQLAASAAAGAPLPLAELATARGYADQAHLTREFAVFAGLPSAAWLRDALEADGPAVDTDWGR
jgi:AraC-like DNA-binding protein